MISRLAQIAEDLENEGFTNESALLDEAIDLMPNTPHHQPKKSAIQTLQQFLTAVGEQLAARGLTSPELINNHPDDLAAVVDQVASQNYL